MRFEDRRDGGARLGGMLSAYRGRRPLVLGIPRGGVIVASEVARALDAPLDIIVVRKIGAPGNEELGIGAIAPGTRVLNEDIIRSFGVSEEEIGRIEARERAEMDRRELVYRGGRPKHDVAGRAVILVDDGIAMGVSARAAVKSLRSQGVSTIVLGTPVCSAEAFGSLRPEVEDLLAVHVPLHFGAVGAWYARFPQTTDFEIIEILERQTRSPAPEAGEGSGPRGRNLRTSSFRATLRFRAGSVTLEGDLDIPRGATGLVVFAHGSGSGRHSTRNRSVAESLRSGGLGTFLIDLLTKNEQAEDAFTGGLRFDIPFLASRLACATSFAATQPATRGLRIGYFGASTGGAAALAAAAERPEQIGAIVVRGGRPDLAWASLPRVRAPALLTVGGADTEVLRLNRDAHERMRCTRETAVVPGATHLFEEPGALEIVASLARRWFVEHLAPGVKRAEPRPLSPSA